MPKRQNNILAKLGMVGPLVFCALVILQGMFQPDYSHIRMPISALAAWPLGWIQQLNFFGLSVCVAALVIGLHNDVQATRRGVIGVGLLLMGCIGLVVAGVFSWVMVDGTPTETMPHVVGAVLSFFCSSTGLIVFSRRMAADSRWRDLSRYVLITGVAMVIMFVALGGFAVDNGTPLHPWAGLLQRVLVVVWFTCLLTLAAKLRRMNQPQAQ